MLSPGTYLQERYEILERIGQGGMSVVYKALCHTLNRMVAIKVLKEEFSTDENFVAKFKMEAQSAARLSHPNIVSIYDVVDDGQLHFIVMELVEGITLKNYIEKKGCLDNKEAIGIAIQVASGIAAAHEQHIIHRDIKPQNIIISRDGKVKVADFGIARAISSQTLNATAVGSVHYISPEQARGGFCDERSDIYSFGITLYEMMTGRLPFEGDNTVTVALAHLKEQPVPPQEYNPEIYDGLQQIILKCTQKRPARRYHSVTETIADLRKVLVNPEADLLDLLGEEETDEAIDFLDEDYTDPVGEDKEPDEDTGTKKRRGLRRAGAFLPNEDEEPDSRLEHIVMMCGIACAILVVAVLLFFFTKLTGIFTQRAGAVQATQEYTVAETEAESELEVSIADNQTYMPGVLGLPEDMAEAKLKEATLVMNVSGYEYSDNYAEGQVMNQEIAEDSIVDKWSSVNVTLSRGSDKVDLEALSLTSLSGTKARALLEEKGLTVETRQETSTSIGAGMVISYSPDQARIGDKITLTISAGAPIVPGQVPNLLGREPAAADAMLAECSLVVGTVSYEPNNDVAAGFIIGQSVEPGTLLTPGSEVSYAVSSGPAEETAAYEESSADDEEEAYYLASIDTTCSLSNYIGPAAQTSSVRVMVRLKQTVDGVDIYTTLMSARLVVGIESIPVVIPRIKGAYGVDSGTVEVVNADTLEVINSYEVTFFPAG